MPKRPKRAPAKPDPVPTPPGSEIPGAKRRAEAGRSLDELAGLTDAAGAEVVLRVLQERSAPDPSTFLGSGKIESLARAAAEGRGQALPAERAAGEGRA